MLTIIGAIEQEWWGRAVEVNDDQFVSHTSAVGNGIKGISFEDAAGYFPMTGKKQPDITLEEYYDESESEVHVSGLDEQLSLRG
jgi:hypothetical protein